MSILDFGKKKKRLEDELIGEEKLTSRLSGSEQGKFSLSGTFEESKMKRYQMAMEKKAILFDKEDKHGVDYTHMDFILSIGCGFHKGMSNLVAIQLFWKSFYPYLKAVTEKYEEFYNQFRSIIDDQEAVLKNHAQLDFKYKWTLEFLKSCNLSKKHEKFLDHQIAEARKGVEEVKKAADNLPNLKEE